MAKNALAKTKPAASTQQYLDIAEVRDDAVILRNGSIRAVLLVSSVNFALKGEDEQNALIYAYINFLNSLEFPLQILIQSRNLNIDGYLLKLANLEKEQTNELLRMQIADYQAFLKELLELGQIMTKKFYVIVPYSGVTEQKRKFWERLTDVFFAAKAIKMSEKHYINYREELQKRVDFVRSGLSSVELASVQLGTQSLLELFYNTYNPEMAESEKMSDINKLQIN